MPWEGAVDKMFGVRAGGKSLKVRTLLEAGRGQLGTARPHALARVMLRLPTLLHLLLPFLDIPL